MAKVKRPTVVGNVASRVGRHEDARRNRDAVQSAVSQRRFVEHFANAFAVGDVGGKANRRAATRNSRTRDADALPQLRGLIRPPSPARLRRSNRRTRCARLRARCGWRLHARCPLPAPITAMTWRASSRSGGIRCNFASSSNQYSMSNASCCGKAT